MSDKDTATKEPVVGAVEIDYSTLSMEQLLEAIGKAYASKDMKLMGQLSKLYTKAEAEDAKVKKAALQAELDKTTITVTARLSALVEEMVSDGILDGAEGVWFALDFGEVRAAGTNPATRLMKAGKRAPSEAGSGSGKSSYVANPAKSADLLAQVGSHVYLDKDTEVTIDKVASTLPAGTTFQQAYDYSTNGGWRNRIRMALLKATGTIA